VLPAVCQLCFRVCAPQHSKPRVPHYLLLSSALVLPACLCLQNPSDAPTMQFARMTPTKIGSSMVGVPAIPIRHAVREITLTAKERWVS
jgi:hypothetical protein